MRITVTSEHARRAEPGNTTGCAVVLAIRDARPGARVLVGRTVASVDGVDYRLPHDAQRFIRELDAGKLPRRFESVTFKLEAA